MFAMSLSEAGGSDGLLFALYVKSFRTACAYAPARKDSRDWEGLSVVARALYRAKKIDGSMKRKLTDLDVTFHVCRHLHQAKANSFSGQLLAQLQGNHGALETKVDEVEPTDMTDIDVTLEDKHDNKLDISQVKKVSLSEVSSFSDDKDKEKDKGKNNEKDKVDAIALTTDWRQLPESVWTNTYSSFSYPILPPLDVF